MSTPPPSATYRELIAPGRRALSAAMVLAILLAALDVLVVGTALPTIVHDLGGVELYAWAISAYGLSTLAALPIFSTLVARWGALRTMTLAVAAFVAGSLLAAAAPSMLVLVIGRGVQGVGAGGLLGLPFVLIAQHTPPGLQPRALALLSATWGAAAVSGPLLGGTILRVASWHWVFLINLPLSAIVLLLAWIALAGRQREPEGQSRPVNLAGPVLLAIGAGLLLSATTIPWPNSALTAAASLVVLVLFACHEHTHPVPVIPSPAWGIGNPLGAAVMSAGLAGAAFLASETFLPLFLQGVWGISPLGAGLVLTVGSLSWTAASIVSARHAEWGPRRLSGLGARTLLTGLGTLFAAVALTLPAPVLYVGFALAGAGMGIAITSYNTAALDVADRYPTGSATAALQLVQTLGNASGAALAGAVARIGFAGQFDPQRLQPGLVVEGLALAALLRGVLAALALSVLLATLTLPIARSLPRLRPAGSHATSTD
ncbi:MAG: MFS transporter [Ardenticatenaceae bacterium]|nr:MFS transporter [Ardenticatenaceae bacterium]HBY94503.1 hypothetical protein [Chloroflexota bacterium]